jgi:ribosomal-protein-alanine N-acetyltransferase
LQVSLYPREVIETPRLVLVPISPELAEAILGGDLTGVRAAEGWPHPNTLDPFRAAVKRNVELPGWFVTLDGVVIGDCHTHGSADAEGDIEIGYGLAEAYRGLGYGTELVEGFSQWLLDQPGIQRVVARHVPTGNVASRRVLERAGFVLERSDEQHAWYALSPH